MLDQVRAAAGRLVSRIYTDNTQRLTQARLAAGAAEPWTPARQYAYLERYYTNVELYDAATRAGFDAGTAGAAIRGLRTPAFQVVEFYVATVWPGRLEEALQIETENPRLEDAIRRVWAWSNWEQKRQVHVRTTTMLGDGFVKIVGDKARGRVYFELLRAGHVTEIVPDERGYLTYCRIDVPIRTVERGVAVARTHTEVWSKETGTYRAWDHDRGDRPIEELGAPGEERTLREMHGDDFIPIVHTKFRDVGDDRGAGAYLFQIDKIDEHNRKATRLAQQLFRSNANTWAIEAGMTPDGRPLAPLKIGEDGSVAGTGVIRLGDEMMLSLPGGYTIKSLVPAIDYAAAHAAEQADGIEIQRDLVEKAYWQIMEQGGNLSGRALRTLLLPAIARAIEARGTFEQSLVRQDEIACTIAAFIGVDGFTELGTYASGALEHSFADREVVPVGDLEEATADVQKATAGKLKLDLGITKAQVQKEMGYDQEIIDEMAQQKEADQGALNEAFGALMDRQPGAVVPVVPANGRPANGQMPQKSGGGNDVPGR